ncbi:MAG: Lrp/AsnC family leucine-responsive transcriptional regulator [Candidatus Azotimanducaceae bacterium]|jgi:Lrp/AsnC family leucine-responsive transcriptional regulator
MVIDKYDLQILDTLQRSGRCTSVELAELVHLSASQCQRRMKKLEDCGLIKHYVALLDARSLGLEVEAIVSVTLSSQGGNPAEQFRQVIAQHPEILECHAVTGEEDYVLKVITHNLKEFSDFLMEHLMSLPIVASVRSNVLLQELKSTTALPLNNLIQSARQP